MLLVRIQHWGWVWENPREFVMIMSDSFCRYKSQFSLVTLVVNSLVHWVKDRHHESLGRNKMRLWNWWVNSEALSTEPSVATHSISHSNIMVNHLKVISCRCCTSQVQVLSEKNLLSGKVGLCLHMSVGTLKWVWSAHLQSLHSDQLRFKGAAWAPLHEELLAEPVKKMWFCHFKKMATKKTKQISVEICALFWKKFWSSHINVNHLLWNDISILHWMP